MNIDHGKVKVSQCNFRIKSKQVIQFESDSSNYNMPPVAKKNVTPLHPKSRVWEYFGDSEDGKCAHCLLCKYAKKTPVNIKVNNGSTQSLRNHMKYLHKKEFEEIEEKEVEERKKDGSKNNENTPKISEAFGKMIKIDLLGKKQSKYFSWNSWLLSSFPLKWWTVRSSTTSLWNWTGFFLLCFSDHPYSLKKCWMSSKIQ